MALGTPSAEAAAAYPTVFVQTCRGAPQSLALDGGTDSPTRGFLDPSLTGLFVSQPWDDQVWEIGAVTEDNVALACDGFPG